MTLSVHAASAAVTAQANHAPNPAQQARTADPTAKGADFGALVSQFAKAKHTAAPPAPTLPPATDLGTPATDVTA
ncbi:hypothetical protein [Phenylobacterium sp.]|jgi:hypothetical protein|uniref:hypothetical protein n=1 Tax=Phenylobacterium sp. TaxID=1871053 RepID=UPI002E323397|nr:hypothetical protein [Phenylobacterium sp.]HEX4712747.1 hypothetical protein [Phenylobacterium sp.]